MLVKTEKKPSFSADPSHHNLPFLLQDWLHGFLRLYRYFWSHPFFYCLVFGSILPSVLWRCWLGGRKGIRPVKTEWWGAGMVICLERSADLHMASWCHCHSLSLASVKSWLILPLWYRLTWVVLDKGPLSGCVYVRVYVCTSRPCIVVAVPRSGSHANINVDTVSWWAYNDACCHRHSQYQTSCRDIKSDNTHR